MQPTQYLKNWLSTQPAHSPQALTPRDLRALYPHLSDGAFKTLLSRAVKANILRRPCRGIYIPAEATFSDGQLLFHIANQLRPNEFNYISLETALSDAGVISQIPMNWVCILSSGRSNLISCGNHGTIEFVHTSRQPNDVLEDLTYNHARGMWQASVSLAIQDMKMCRRNCDLIDWEAAREFI